MGPPSHVSSSGYVSSNGRWRSSALVLFGLLGACAGTQRGTIGAVLGQQSGGRVYLREVPSDLAAGKAGLQADDEILLVDGQDVRMLSPKQLHKLLTGEVDHTVKLTVIRGEEVIRVTVKRSPARSRVTGLPPRQ